jgi:hypothetical protein
MQGFPADPKIAGDGRLLHATGDALHLWQNTSGDILYKL